MLRIWILQPVVFVILRTIEGLWSLVTSAAAVGGGWIVLYFRVPGGACDRGGVAVGTGTETETGRVRCDWGLGIRAFPDLGFLLSLTLLPSVFFPFLFLTTASLCGWGPPSSNPAAGRCLSFSLLSPKTPTPAPLFRYKSIRADNGPEFISRDLDLWAYQNDVILDFSRPGRPTDNAFIESFNGKFRAECLNAHWFMSLEDAREKLETWRRDYNEVRPHSAIGYKVPKALMKREKAEQPACA